MATHVSATDRPWERECGLGLLLFVSGSTFAAHLLHAAEPHENTFSFAYGILVPLVFALAVLVLTIALARSDFPGWFLFRVGTWTLAAAVGTGLIGLLMVLYQASHGIVMVDRGYVILDSATLGSAIGAVIGIYDGRRRITVDRLDVERRKTERLHQRLRVLNRVLRHDIRNDVNVIRGYAALMRSEDDASADRLDVISDRASQLARTGEYARRIERLVDEEGHTAEPIDLVAVTTAAADAVRHDYPDAQVNTDVPERRRVLGNALLSAAVANIVENAVRHNDRPEPRVDVTLETTDETATLRVADDGPGIPAEEIDLVSRGDETPLRHSSGLGLWLATWAVEEADGTVSFEKNDSRGSVVRLTLPRAR